MKRGYLGILFATGFLILLLISFVSAGWWGNFLGKITGRAVDLSTNLVAYYPFEGNANDASGNGNGGVVNGAIVASGKIGNAYYFDGVNDYIEVPKERLNIYGPVTVSAWIKASGNMTGLKYYNILAKESIYSSGYGIEIYGSKPWIEFWTRNLNKSASAYWSLLNNSINDKWIHVVGVFDGTYNKLYINGALVNTRAGAVPSPTGLYPLRIGYSGNPKIGDSYFSGAIDEVKIWDKALTVEDVKAEYNRAGACTPNCAGKVCGSDGCGGSCGTCASGQTCNSNGQCYANYSCTDTDGGINYYLKGIISGTIGSGGSYEDYCLNTTHLIERHCLSGDNYNFTIMYYCMYGCSNGACIVSNGTFEVNKCNELTSEIKSKIEELKNNSDITLVLKEGQPLKEHYYITVLNGKIPGYNHSSPRLVEVTNIDLDIGTAGSTSISSDIIFRDVITGETGEIRDDRYITTTPGTKTSFVWDGRTYTVETIDATTIKVNWQPDNEIDYFNCPPPSSQTCTDSDGGLNFSVKGFMKSGSSDSGQWDSCYDNSTLVEYYCQNNEGNKTEYVCPSGCLDGACLDEIGLATLSAASSDSGGFWGWLKGLFGF